MIKGQPGQAEAGESRTQGDYVYDLYDPDLTRVELMEFRPVQKPCCSDFHGPYPGPDKKS